jgi:small-conductance mechanosensitive channel
MSIESLHELGRVTYYGNELGAWAKAFVQFAVWFTVLPIARVFIMRRLKKQEAHHPVAFLLLLRALIDATTRILMIAIAIYLAMRWLEVPARLDRIIGTTIQVVVWWQVGLWLTAAVTHLIEVRRGSDLAGAEGTASLNILRFVGVLLVWVVAFLMLLANLGVKIMPLVAGLGIGGVAIALALQNILGDLFASLSIALDKPFVVGDSLVIDTYIGKVEHIGIKTTRLRSETGEQIILSNADILKSRVRNFGRAQEQRALATIRVTYDTPADILHEIPKLLEGIVREQANARFERCHLKTLGDSALLFELSYFVQQPSLNPLLDLQQAVNFRIIDEFRRMGVEFDQPTQRVILTRQRIAAEATTPR